MLSLIAALMLTSPAPCAWWSRAEHRCRDADVEVIGSWDPRPPPSEWSQGYSQPEPRDWGAYPLEQPAPASQTLPTFTPGPYERDYER